jgi:hypothetical protein
MSIARQWQPAEGMPEHHRFCSVLLRVPFFYVVMDYTELYAEESLCN